jgi:ketosteroid isomerase-like protein
MVLSPPFAIPTRLGGDLLIANQYAENRAGIHKALLRIFAIGVFMNRILTAIVLAVALSTLVSDARALNGGKTANDDKTEQALRRIENELLDAFVRSDTDALDRIWAEEFSFTAPNGTVVSKENYLSLMKTGSLKYEVVKLEDLKVRVYGDTAVAAGRITVKGKVGTHIIDGQDRYLTVYVKRQGRWQQVATHASRIAQQPAQ